MERIVALLVPIESKKEKDIVMSNCIDYAVDLYNGISRKKNYCFGRTMGHNVTVCDGKIMVYAQYDVAKIHSFLSFISILQFILIDEQIFLGGVIDLEDALVPEMNCLYLKHKHKLCVAGINVCDGIQANYNWYNDNENRYLPFLDDVYSYEPFKDMKSNLMRHIIKPIGEYLSESTDEKKKRINLVIEYIQDYISRNAYDDVHINIH